MKVNPGYTDRRQHTRASVKNIVVGFLNSNEPEIIGSITDISLGGLKLTYNELRMEPPKHPIHSIDVIADNNYLLDIPCEYAWDDKVKTQSESELTNLRQYGIQFGKLTPRQRSLLRSLIDYCGSLRINSISSNARMNDR